MTKKISFQGELGAYSHLACKNVFADYEAVPCRNFNDALTCVSEGQTDLAMIPVENSAAGRVADIHKLVGNSDLKIVAIKERTIDIGINCPHCLTEARVSAQIATNKKVVPVIPVTEMAPEISTQAHITPEALEGLRDQITHLSSSDIEHLGTE